MKCEKCNLSVFNTPLHRVNEKCIKGVFWCERCIKQLEPELHNNIQDDKTCLDIDLINICYNNNKN